MLNFVMLVGAFVLANLITVCLAYAIMLNKTLMKWLSKKFYKTTLEFMEELNEEMYPNSEEES